jgi:hypothetical protein
MKKSELKQIIREEISIVLNEATNDSENIKRLKAALIKTNEHAPGGVFKNELKKIIQQVVELYKKLDPKLKQQLVDLEEKHAEMQAKNSGRPIKDVGLEKFYKKVVK